MANRVSLRSPLLMANRRKQASLIGPLGRAIPTAMTRCHLGCGIVFLCLIIGSARAEEANLLPKVSFENTVCDLGQVGLGTKNTCEFKFTNTGRGPLRMLARPKGRKQIRSTIRQNDGGQESEILDKPELPKLKIQNEP